MPPDRPQGLLLCYQLLLQKTTDLLQVLSDICQHSGNPPAFQMALRQLNQAPYVQPRKMSFELKSNKPFPLEKFPPLPLPLTDSCHYNTFPIPPGLFTNSALVFANTIGRITRTFWTTRMCMNYLATAQQTDFQQKALDYLYWTHRAPRLILEKIIQVTHIPCAASVINRGTLALGEHLFPSFVHYLFQVIKFVTSYEQSMWCKSETSYKASSLLCVHYTAMLG